MVRWSESLTTEPITCTQKNNESQQSQTGLVPLRASIESIGVATTEPVDGPQTDPREHPNYNRIDLLVHEMD